MKLRSIALAVTLAALPALAIAQAQHQGHGAGMPMQGAASGGMSMGGGGSMQQMMEMMAPKPGDTPFVRDFKQAHMKMMQDMHFPVSGNPDQDFVRGMLPHHQGAVDMAKVQLQHGKDPELRKLAETIISDQEREIAQMNTWSKKNAK